jgi:hypothetical protein
MKSLIFILSTLFALNSNLFSQGKDSMSKSILTTIIVE